MNCPRGFCRARFVTLHLHRRHEEGVHRCGRVAVGGCLYLRVWRGRYAVGVRIEQGIAVEMHHLNHLPLLHVTANWNANARSHHFREVSDAAVADSKGLGIVECSDCDNRFHQQRRHSLFLVVKNNMDRDRNHNSRDHKPCTPQNFATHERIGVNNGNDCRRLP